MGGCLSVSKSSNKGNHGVNVATQPHTQHGTGTSSDKKSMGSHQSAKKIEETPSLNDLRDFTFNELAAATQYFKPENFLRNLRFGRVYKGRLDTGKVVAVSRLDKTGTELEEQFRMEVKLLSNLDHAHLVNLIGYCAVGDERLLVYDFMPLGSLADHLYDLKPNMQPLDWDTRIKIALGAAKGLEYLHNTAKPPVIFIDLEPSKILLEDGYHPRLSDIGLAKLWPVCNIMPRYYAPEYIITGYPTFKSDVYTFGIVLLEIITGRRSYDKSLPRRERDILTWAHSLCKDPWDLPDLADPLLYGQYPFRGLLYAVVIAKKCLEEQPHLRPSIFDVVQLLSYVASITYKPPARLTRLDRQLQRTRPPQELP